MRASGTGGIISGIGSLVFCATVCAQPYLGVPHVFTQSPQVFRDLFASSRCNTVRVVIFGDSQENSPLQVGAARYMPRLQFEFWSRAGRAPETPWTRLGLNIGGGAPFGDWLWRGNAAANSVTPTRVAGSRILPGINPAATSTTNGNNVNQNQVYGNLLMLDHTCASVNNGINVAGLAPYFVPANGVMLDVLAATHPQSGGVRVRVTPAPGSQPGYFFPTTAILDSAITLQGPEGGYTVERFGPLPMGSGVTMQVEVSGTDPQALTDIVSARFVSAAAGGGWSITSLSHGGYSAADVIIYHAQSGPMLRVLGPDAAIFCFGANDCNLYDRAAYRGHVENLIAFIRANTRADLPIILIADPAHINVPTQFIRDNLDNIAVANHDIALTDPLVCAVNSRRLTHEAGWTYTNSAPYVYDGVHYTAHGATVKAQLEAQALFGAFFPPAADCNTNGIDDGCDIAAGTSHDLNADGVPDECACSPDVNCDFALDGFDVAAQERAIGGDLTDYCLPDPDYNGDFALDGFDVAAVEIGVGGGDCP